MNDPVPARPKRCAIYTRKSAEPPLGQEVTSLESQRAICAAYACSQQHKGWTLLERHYDDPGRSGATLVRPALQELMADIDAGLVDIVLVYKLDRITRTLLDFVRLIDFFDRYGVAFVSITQNFDTSDSMGRLIRNILLTFAQFEREIASDRMRDKKMVMRQRGLWAGGNAPLGYALKKGKLIVKPREVDAICCIFETYVAERSIAAVHKRLLADGHRREAWRSRAGERHGPARISISSLHHILRNPVYIGETVHRGERFPGIHAPIVERALWDAAQTVLKERERFKPRQPGHILTGLLFDAFGRRMHARVFNRHAASRYYESAIVAWAERQGIRPVRLQADQSERLVLAGLRQLLADRMRIRPLLMRIGVTGLDLDNLSAASGAGAIRLERLPLLRLSAVIKVLIARVEVAIDAMRLLVRLEAVARFLAWDGLGIFAPNQLETTRATLHLVEIPVAATRERRRSWLPIEPRTRAAAPAPGLVALLDDARAAFKLVFDHRNVPVADLARSLGRKTGSFSRLVRLHYLAPDIVAAILDGRQPPGLSRHQLLECDLPMDWALQRRLLGFPAREEAWPRARRGDALALSLGGTEAIP
jgi:DNA invertase Pin-like site-specific DNA recombinase